MRPVFTRVPELVVYYRVLSLFTEQGAGESTTRNSTRHERTVHISLGCGLLSSDTKRGAGSFCSFQKNRKGIHLYRAYI